MKTHHAVVRNAWSRRPVFAPKQKLTAEQLNAGSKDDLNRQRILNRAIHGYGVVIGYGLSVHHNSTLDLWGGCLELGEGLALDRHGRMLVWEGGRLGIDDFVGDIPDQTGTYTLVAHYAVRAPEQDRCFARKLTWAEEGVVFTLHRDLNTDTNCCPSHPWDRCVSHEEYLHRRSGGLPNKNHTVGESPDAQWYTEEPGRTHDLCSHGWEYDPDPRVGVPLARVEICDLVEGNADQRDCDPQYGFCPDTVPDVITVRPLVYRNPLLYELARCCDVDAPKVETISWANWTNGGWENLVPWEAFAELVADQQTGFEVWFTRPLNPTTLHEASIFITVFYQDGDASWRNYRMPLAELIPLQRDEKIQGVRLIPDQDDWVPSEITGRQSNLFHGIRIEITIRGQLIRDNCDRMLDARPVGAACDVRCQARPGGDLITSFQVGPQHLGRDGADANPSQTPSEQSTEANRNIQGA